jgi:predicted nucleotidyltransferase
MITPETLRSFNDEEIGVLLYVLSIALPHIEPKYDFIKLFKVDVLLYELEKLKNKLEEEKKTFISNLQKKVYEGQ